MDEGTSEIVVAPQAASWPAKTSNWDTYQRPPPPDGYRDSHRWVTVPSSDVEKRGRNSKVWGYNVRTIARLAGVATNVVRKAIAAGTVQPHDIGSVLHWVIRQVRPGDTADFETLPPLWRHLDNFTLLAGAPRQGRSPNAICLAVPMPPVQAREEMIRLFWAHRGKISGFVGNSSDLARRLLELDGIDPGSLGHQTDPSGRVRQHRHVRQAAKTLRQLVTIGVLTHDESGWAMAPAPVDLDGVTEGLRSEGFAEAEILERHIAIGRDLFSLPAARRLLAYMRTNRLKANRCGRDRRLWIVTGMDRAFHGYKERKVFRQRGLRPDDGDPADLEPRA